MITPEELRLKFGNDIVNADRRFTKMTRGARGQALGGHEGPTADSPTGRPTGTGEVTQLAILFLSPMISTIYCNGAWTHEEIGRHLLLSMIYIVNL